MQIKIKTYYFLLLLILTGCQSVSDDGQSEYSQNTYFSDLEQIENGNFLDSLGEVTFSDAELVSNDFSFSGNNSIKLDSTHKYGLNISITNPREGELFQVSVWQKNGAKDGTLLCSMKGENPRIVRTWKGNIEKEGWHKHNMSFVVGNGVDTLDFYVFAGGELAYFDDIKIKRFSGIPKVGDIERNKLKIYIPDSSNHKLQSYVDNALKSSIISKKNKKYVAAFIVNDYDSIPIEMRLKGDWTDHLTSGKTSYRIKVEGNNAFLGLKTFSIQHPKTRNYLHEWFMHKLCDDEDLLSTKFEMLPVEINDVNKGVYAIEEHFDKQLLEARNRREGPILKLDESGVWALSYLVSEKGLNKSYPYYRSSFVSMFKQKRTLKKGNQRNQFVEGAKLLTLFKNHYETVEDLFDMKSLAKYYALMELGAVDHALAWHNRRFYFNPVTQKLELIGFDMLPAETVMKMPYILNKIEKRPDAVEELQLTKMTLKNKQFKSYYLEYLVQFTDSLNLNKAFEKYDSALVQNEKMIAVEVEDYEFDRGFYYKRANYLRSQIPRLDSLWEIYLKKDVQKNDFILKSNYSPNTDDFMVEEVSVNAYRTKLDSAKFLIELENYHLNKLIVIGYEDKHKTQHKLSNPISLAGYNDDLGVDSSHFLATHKPKKIIFKIENNLTAVYDKKVIKYSRPKGMSTRMELKSKFKINSPYYKISGDRLIFNGGTYTIDELIYIPSEFKVTIPTGANINFINGGGIIVNSDLIAAGDNKHPIIISGEDENNHGITVLNGGKVVLRYVNFNKLNTLHYKKWNLTGAVSIYETQTEIINCKVINNYCEDGLNIIRSNFSIDSLYVENTYSDGFDADFCTGEIKNSTFVNTGNDCIDFSGSEVNINHINITNSGDKGISGGERSSLIISDIDINGAITGIAAKDDTKITGDNVSVTNAEFGLAAFQKKAEYNRGIINLSNVTYSNLQEFGLVEVGSYAVINGKYFYGGMLVDVDALYARFDK